MKATLQLRIGTHRFKVSVEEDAKADTIAAAKRVERMLGEIGKESRTPDRERAALMVALKLAMGAREAGDGGSSDPAVVEAVLDEALGMVDGARAGG